MIQPQHTYRVAAVLALAFAFLTLPTQARAQDFERPGLYLGGGAFWLGEQFGDELDSEVEEALDFDDADLSVSDSRGASAVLGVRMGSRFALELAAERYDDLDFELTVDGMERDGD